LHGVSSVIDRANFFPGHFIRDGTKTMRLHSPELCSLERALRCGMQALVSVEQLANRTRAGISTMLCVQ
jgi:hypothetical protein